MVVELLREVFGDDLLGDDAVLEGVRSEDFDTWAPSYGLGSSVQDKTGRGLRIRSRSMRDGQVENPNQGGYGLEGWSTSESE